MSRASDDPAWSLLDVGGRRVSEATASVRDSSRADLIGPRVVYAHDAPRSPANSRILGYPEEKSMTGGRFYADSQRLVSRMFCSESSAHEMRSRAVAFISCSLRTRACSCTRAARNASRSRSSTANRSLSGLSDAIVFVLLCLPRSRTSADRGLTLPA